MGLGVTININETMIAQVHAVRTNPKSKTVKDGTICSYNVVYMNVTVDTIKGAYGCSVDLAIQLLEQWKEHNKQYKMIAMIKLTEDMKG